MANLAIKGHRIRGKEVIEILEMLGGKNELQHNGSDNNKLYIIKNGEIHLNFSAFAYCFEVFTLEEFIEKFPYKIGDEVLNVQGTVMPCQIKGMYWDNNCVKYYCEGTIRKGECFDRTAEQLQPYKEQETMEEQIKIDIPKGYEVVGVDDDNHQVLLKKIKPKYPKTYEDCFEVLMGKTNFQDFELTLTKFSITQYEENIISPDPPYISPINALYKLIISRDAYWKIAGEQMGLGKPWEPDWNNLSTTHEFIKINKGCFTYSSRVLVFPTAEMRDAFYENFKDLIEECKEFL